MADPWRCEYCGVRKPVPSLARDCEMRHLSGDAEDAAPLSVVREVDAAFILARTRRVGPPAGGDIN